VSRGILQNGQFFCGNHTINFFVLAHSNQLPLPRLSKRFWPRLHLVQEVILQVPYFSLFTFTLLFIRYRVWCSINGYGSVRPTAAAAVDGHKSLWQHDCLRSSEAHVRCSSNNCKHAIRRLKHCRRWCNDALWSGQSEQGTSWH